MSNSISRSELLLPKILAVLGLIVMLVGSSNIGANIIGVVLYLVGMYMIADRLNNKDIFRFALISSIALAVGVIIAAIIVGAGALLGFLTLHPGVALGTMIVALVIVYIAILATGWFKKRLMEQIEPHTETIVAVWAGRLYWWGAILTIIIIGLLLVFIAMILEIIALVLLR
jgi:uncharacterized membrane protein